MSALQAAPSGKIIADSSLISDVERRRSRFYNDLLGAHGLDRGLYASVARCGNSLMFLAAQRSAKIGDYDLAEIDALRRLVPHLHRSYRTWLRIGDTELQRQAALTAVEQMTLGFAIVDADGRLHFANPVAEEELSRGALTVNHGRVTTRAAGSAQELSNAVRAAARHNCPIAERVVLRGDAEDRSACSILVAPVRNQAAAAWHKGPLAMLLISRGASEAVEDVALSRLYELTPAETRLLCALMQGERLPNYARRQGIAVSTARTHLQGLFNKMGERRQTDLVRRALADPLLRAAMASMRSAAGG